MDDLLPILGWVIHYGDGSKFNSTDGSWGEAPERDVQIVELLHETPYRTLITGLDEYVIPGETKIKYGAWMDEAAFYALQDEVVNLSA